jgi:Holliday junction resolvase-like predicted endonuclease
MNEFFPDRAAVLAKAARLVESTGLTVLDRDCQAGGHRLDFVAITSDRTVVVVEVTVTEPDAVRIDAASIASERMLELLHGGAAWLYAHDGDYADFRVDSVVLSPDGLGQVVPWPASKRRRQTVTRRRSGDGSHGRQGGGGMPPDAGAPVPARWGSRWHGW